jgi:hypothetical protein
MEQMPDRVTVYRLNFRAPCIGMIRGKWEIVIGSMKK